MSIDVSRPMMGGVVSVQILDVSDAAWLGRAAVRVLDRIEAWAGRLTRFWPDSDLMRLNAATTSLVPIGPTLTAALDWARMAEGMTDGLVDASLLDERLAAEAGLDPSLPVGAGRCWSLRRTARGAAVEREPGVRFDLGGVAKGWLADRALAITPGRSALVDADGDVAVRVAPGDTWAIGIGDPREPGTLLGALDLGPDGDLTREWGIATSGTSVHRWTHAAGGDTHHLIDPRTQRPAATDVIQATVLADTARAAEAFAKTAVIAGSDRAFGLLDRPGVHGVLLLTRDGDLRATPGMVRWLQ
ncbi:MAG: FAD:protein FMN transferase [Chloroflexota bacterium]|nr:FAD:protein FMN transferase [Chloroflexota bacterium]